ncbi:MAG: D-glycero-beta-D-manno-heptose 1-phosphate adenylyltransferase [Candidatus Omnitrophica bacterium]|nr:D-glycero-beta-D-manno-heptose 1-phosphate adenylyltransferase [Candidatus Omnitrophota bacterium]
MRFVSSLRTGCKEGNFAGVTTDKKIIGLKALQGEIARVRHRGKTIAFTNGCFDILHLGHVQYLEKAKGRDRVLIIGLNSDRSVRLIKGPRRPIVSQKARARVLAALACVDYVTVFNEDTPEKLIAALKPDILIKGADWKGKKIAGSDTVRRIGGRVEYIRYIPQYSSTKIIAAVLRKS